MITERAMLAAVHISIWAAVKHDRKVSRDVANQHGAHESAGRYNKQLLRGAEKLEALRSLAGQIRQHFYKITLPWSDEGYRLLPAHFYFELTTRMREFERVFSQSVEEFLEVYPSYIEQVRPELNGLFREDDYPSTEKLRTKFGVKLEVLPIPSGDDFRVTLSEEEQARVAREIDESVRLSLNRGTKDLWVRLTDVLTHMVDKLNEPESRFHASLVTNILDLVDLLPRLNVNQDEELNRFAAEIKDRLCNFSSHDLKKNEILRAATASDAAQILSQMDLVLRGREEEPSAPTTPGGFGQVLDAPEPEGDDTVVEQAREWKIAVEQAENIAKLAGKLPAGVTRSLEESEAAGVDWRELLRRAWSGTIPSDYSWLPPNRRHIWAGLYLPGVRSEGAGEIAIAVDCSGSINARQLGLFEAEIRSILEGQRPSRVHVLYFDTEVRRFVQVQLVDRELWWRCAQGWREACCGRRPWFQHSKAR
jgi:Putative metallopeptidase domain/VWA-like domain (DUF2201)